METSASAIVRRFSGKKAGANKGNAQKIYVELVAEMSTGMAARSQRQEIETRIRTLRLTHQWTNGVVQFLNHFDHLVQDLHELRDERDLIKVRTVKQNVRGVF